MAGKGDRPRNCFSQKFLKNYDDIFGKQTTIKNDDKLAQFGGRKTHMNTEQTQPPAELGASTGSALAVGDYVLATKYSDGDPQDHWCVGYYAGITASHYNPSRFDVVDGEGKQFRGNGFRRVEKITSERGEWILKHASDIELSGLSVWHFATCPMDEPNNIIEESKNTKK